MSSARQPRIGAHLPVGKGLKYTADEARRLGLEALQVFLRNPRGAKARELDEEEVAYFRETVRDLGLFPVVVHIPYISNPAASKENLYQLAYQVIAEDLARCDVIGADYLVLHPGAYTTSSREAGMARLVDLLNRILDGYVGSTKVLVETMSGQGSELGGSLEEMSFILGGVTQASRIGVCLDTCHLYAAGYDLATPEGIEVTREKLEKTIGLERVRLVHANDSTRELGSRRDRHAHVGEGFIGEEGFRLLCHHPFFSKLPFILETPYAGVARDVETLKRLRDSETVVAGNVL